MSVLFIAKLQAPWRKLTAQFSSSHWACLASDCPLQRGAFFPPLWVTGQPGVRELVLSASPTAITSRGTPKGTCRASHGLPSTPRLPASPMGVGSLIPGSPMTTLQHVLSPTLPSLGAHELGQPGVKRRLRVHDPHARDCPQLTRPSRSTIQNLLYVPTGRFHYFDPHFTSEHSEAQRW